MSALWWTVSWGRLQPHCDPAKYQWWLIMDWWADLHIKSPTSGKHCTPSMCEHQGSMLWTRSPPLLIPLTAWSKMLWFQDVSVLSLMEICAVSHLMLFGQTESFSFSFDRTLARSSLKSSWISMALIPTLFLPGVVWLVRLDGWRTLQAVVVLKSAVLNPKHLLSSPSWWQNLCQRQYCNSRNNYG